MNHERYSNWLMPVAADGLAAVALFWGKDRLAQPLTNPAGWNALWLAVVYVLFCVGVYLIRKLLPTGKQGRWRPPALLLNTKLRAGLAIIVSLLMTTTLAYQLGYFASLQNIRTAFMNEGNSMSFFVFGPGAWLSAAMLYVLVLAFPVNATVGPQTKNYRRVGFAGLLLVNGLLLFVAAQWGAFIQSGLNWSVAGLFLILLIIFLPPRLLYQERQPYWPGIVSFAGLMIICVLLVHR